MNETLEKSEGGNGPSSTATEASGGEGKKQNKPSSSSQQQEVEDVLANFREKWQKELVSPKRPNTFVIKAANKREENEDFELKARNLFLKGIDMERAGKLYEAIQYYRRAVQIVPDIEFKLDRASKSKLKDRQLTEENENENAEEILYSKTEDSDDEEIKDLELLARIQRNFANVPPLCIPKFEQTTTHISQVPVEIIFYILRWVVSNDLDLRSLESFSTVCRGFYLCARDPEIWRLACLRVWGLNCGPSPDNYGSWREMFIDRPRIHFNGCYISRTTYIRHGESGFQDQFYQSWHLIAYYRYFRFFPEGTVLMLTSSDEPSQCVGLMKSRNSRNPILSGYYRLKDDKVTIVLGRQEAKTSMQGFKRNPRKRDVQESAEQTFHMEFQIKNYQKKRHIKLVWTHYSVFTKKKRGDENTCNFELIANRFPPLWFSRVKSFTAESENPLT